MVALNWVIKKRTSLKKDFRVSSAGMLAAYAKLVITAICLPTHKEHIRLTLKGNEIKLVYIKNYSFTCLRHRCT